MSDSEDEPSAGESSGSEQSDDSGPSTSWGVRKRPRLKKKLVSDDSEDEDLPRERQEIEEESGDEEDPAEERLEGEDMESGDSDSSSDTPGAETCAICLGRMRGEVGSPDSCEHIFCLICILEWAKTNPTCPQDRKPFGMVIARKAFSGPIDKKIPIKKQEEEELFIPEVDNPTYCEVCSECDREERLLLCDGCDLGYHLECLNPPLTQVPVEEWFCPDCIAANIPSAVTNRGEGSRVRSGSSRSGQFRPRTSSQQSRRPRLIPRTRATERIRARIVKRKREKRKRRKQGKKKKIESGELDDPRPPVKHLTKLSFFVKGDNDIDAEHTVDDFADQLLAGASGHRSFRCQEDRKANAARLLRDSAFVPQTTYSGKTPSAIISRINTQTEVREDDILSGILENQSIALSSSKKIILTDDRKLAKQKGKDDDDLCNMFQEENLIMSEPLPSRRPPPQKTSDVIEPEKKEKRSSSPSSSSFHHRPYLSDSWRHSKYDSKSRSRSPYERAQEDEDPSLSMHQSPLEDKRRSLPTMSFQRHFIPQHDRRERRPNYLPHRKGFNDHWYDKWSGKCEQPGYQRGNSPHRKSYLRQIPLNETPHKHSNTEDHSGYKGNFDRSHVEFNHSRDSSWRKRDSPKRRYDGRSHRERKSPYRKERTHERRDHSQQRNHSFSRGYKSYDRTERDYSINRSCRSGRQRSRSRSRSCSRSPSRSREHSNSHGSSGARERKPRSQWSYSYFTSDDGNASIKSSTGSHSLHNVHNLHVPSMSSNSGGEMEVHVGDDKKTKNAKTDSEIKFSPKTEETFKLSSTSGNDSTHESMELSFNSKNSDDNECGDKTDIHVSMGTDKLLSCRARCIAELSKVKDNEQEFFKPLESSAQKEQSTVLNEDQELRKSIQEYCVSSKENVNTSPCHSENSKVDKESNWSQDNWNSVSYHDKRAFDDSESFVMKHTGRKRKILTSLFGEDEGIECSKEEEKDMVIDEREKMSKSKTKDKSSKSSSYTELFGNDSEEEIVTSIPTLPKVSLSTLGNEKKTSEESDKTNLYMLQSGTQKDNARGPIETGIKNKGGHHKANPNVTDTVSNNHLMDKRIQEAKSLLILHSLFGDKGSKAVKSNTKSSKCDNESSHPAKDFVSKDKIYDDKHISSKDKNHKDKCKGRLSNEISSGTHSKKSEVDKLSSRHSEHLTTDSGKTKKPHNHDTKKDSKAKDSKAGVSELKDTRSLQNSVSESSHSKTKIKDHHVIPKEPVAKEFGGKPKKEQSIISDLFGDIDIDSSTSSDSSMTKQEKQGKSFFENKDWKEQLKSFGKFSSENCSTRQATEKWKHTEEEKYPKYQTYETEATSKHRKDNKRDSKKLQDSTKKSSQDREETKEKVTEVAARYKPIESEPIAVASSYVKKAVPEDNKKDSNLRTKKASLEAKVVEEVKKWLDPYYRDKSVTKDEYKQIVAKCVNKVIAAECGDVIETEKMRTLVEGYVKLFKHRRIKSQPSSIH